MKYIFIDLDETLISSCYEEDMSLFGEIDSSTRGEDSSLPRRFYKKIKFFGKNVFILKRPGIEEFLESVVSSFPDYKVGILSLGSQSYVDAMVQEFELDKYLSFYHSLKHPIQYNMDKKWFLIDNDDQPFQKYAKIGVYGENTKIVKDYSFINNYIKYYEIKNETHKTNLTHYYSPNEFEHSKIKNSDELEETNIMKEFEHICFKIKSMENFYDLSLR